MAYEMYFQMLDARNQDYIYNYKRNSISLLDKVMMNLTNAYSVVQIPVVPSKVTTKISNKNKTVELMNFGEFNILNSAGLTEYSFELEFPSSPRDYATYPKGFKEPVYFLDMLNNLKANRTVFRFILLRIKPDGKTLHDTNVLVNIEEYDIEDNWEEGMDAIVSIKLKQYKEIATVVRVVKKEKDGKNTKKKGKMVTKTEIGKSKKQLISSYVVKKGDNLWNICKRVYGDGSRAYEIAKYNHIKNANLIYPGDIIKFPER